VRNKSAFFFKTNAMINFWLAVGILI
jgi:hypothetical protein